MNRFLFKKTLNLVAIYASFFKDDDHVSMLRLYYMGGYDVKIWRGAKYNEGDNTEGP